MKTFTAILLIALVVLTLIAGCTNLANNGVIDSNGNSTENTSDQQLLDDLEVEFINDTGDVELGELI